MDRSFHEIWISIGSNVENASEKILIALQELSAIDPELKSSSLYQTHALNMVDPDYVNGVVRIRTDIDVDDLRSRLKDIEVALGRTLQSKMEGRVEIDLDIVILDGEVLREKDFHQEYFKKGYKEFFIS